MVLQQLAERYKFSRATLHEFRLGQLVNQFRPAKDSGRRQQEDDTRQSMAEMSGL
jgi:hypothetical protein